MQNIVILGSTGSIGRSTLDVLSLHPESFNVYGITANNNDVLLLQQIIQFKPNFAWISDTQKAKNIQDKVSKLNILTEVLTTTNQLISLVQDSEVNIVMSAIVGCAGLLPTYAAIKASKKILLANKESLVVAGSIIMDASAKYNSTIIPVDSEHSAIYQSLPFGYKNLNSIGVNKIILTASGGPFRQLTKPEIAEANYNAALKHPNWSMGNKISIDSATMMNKGLEVIEAYHLFNCNIDQIDVVVHPQSIIHSMVEYIDGSIISQMGTPDMKTPIAYALSSPLRIASGSSKLDFLQLSNLTFEAPNYTNFPCLKLAFDCIKAGGNSAAILNAANEFAVAEYLQDKIKFYDINRLIEKALNKFTIQQNNSIEDIIELDQAVKDFLKN